MAHYANGNGERKRAVKGRPDVNGIDYLEVHDDPGMPQHLRQRLLTVTTLNPLVQPLGEGQDPEAQPPAPLLLERDHILVVGGDPPDTVPVLRVRQRDLASATRIEVEVARPGGFGAYTLSLVAPGGEQPLEPLDPPLSRVTFSFKVACPTDADCLPGEPEGQADRPGTVIDYETRDYAGFRRLMLDRMAVTLPAWEERNPADIGVALVEALAYAADQTSYLQDAVATEAYLGTARQRVSVRRHARLLDHHLHEGCNARAWVCLEAAPGVQGRVVPEGLVLQTRPGDARSSSLKAFTGLPDDLRPETRQDD